MSYCYFFWFLVFDFYKLGVIPAFLFHCSGTVGLCTYLCVRNLSHPHREGARNKFPNLNNSKILPIKMIEYVLLILWKCLKKLSCLISSKFCVLRSVSIKFFIFGSHQEKVSHILVKLKRETLRSWLKCEQPIEIFERLSVDHSAWVKFSSWDEWTEGSVVPVSGFWRVVFLLYYSDDLAEQMIWFQSRILADWLISWPVLCTPERADGAGSSLGSSSYLFYVFH